MFFFFFFFLLTFLARALQTRALLVILVCSVDIFLFPYFLICFVSIFPRLLFNTQENPYKKYVTIDPLLGAVTKTRDAVDEEAAMAAAPQTILTGEGYQHVEVRERSR